MREEHVQPILIKILERTRTMKDNVFRSISLMILSKYLENLDTGCCDLENIERLKTRYKKTKASTVPSRAKLKHDVTYTYGSFAKATWQITEFKSCFCTGRASPCAHQMAL